METMGTMGTMETGVAASLASPASLGCRIVRAPMESRRLGGCIVRNIAARTAALRIADIRVDATVEDGT
ncbi:MAG: hypothetical protein IKR48_01200 [Kiritimatiellae bacterium]|nr:hypothetical protein [Kiritimatiellia bacterium]